MAKVKKNFSRNLALACSNDSSQEAMHYVIFKDDCAVCTDGYVLVKQALRLHGFTPDEIQQINGKAMHKDVFAEVFKYDQVKVTNGELLCEKGKVKARFPLENIEGMRLPDYNSVMPTDDDDLADVSAVAIDLKNLDRVRKLTLNDNAHVHMRFTHELGNKCVVIQGYGLALNEECILVMRLKDESVKS